MDDVLKETGETVVGAANFAQYLFKLLMSNKYYLVAGALVLILLQNKGKASIGKAIKLG